MSRQRLVDHVSPWLSFAMVRKVPQGRSLVALRQRGSSRDETHLPPSAARMPTSRRRRRKSGPAAIWVAKMRRGRQRPAKVAPSMDALTPFGLFAVSAMLFATRSKAVAGSLALWSGRGDLVGCRNSTLAYGAAAPVTVEAPSGSAPQSSRRRSRRARRPRCTEGRVNRVRTAQEARLDLLGG